MGANGGAQDDLERSVMAAGAQRLGDPRLGQRTVAADRERQDEVHPDTPGRDGDVLDRGAERPAEERLDNGFNDGAGLDRGHGVLSAGAHSLADDHRLGRAQHRLWHTV